MVDGETVDPRRLELDAHEQAGHPGADDGDDRGARGPRVRPVHARPPWSRARLHYLSSPVRDAGGGTTVRIVSRWAANAARTWSPMVVPSSPASRSYSRRSRGEMRMTTYSVGRSPAPLRRLRCGSPHPSHHTRTAPS